MSSNERPSKKEAFKAFLTEGWVSVHLDARRTGVDVPAELAGNRHLVLQYGRDMPIPIPDLEVGEEGVSATLSFSRLPHRTYVPWSAIYIVTCDDGRGVLYYEDVPEDVSLLARPAGPVAEKGIGTAAPALAADPQQEQPATARILKSVPATPDDELSELTTKRRRRPTLKLVK